MKSPRCIIIAGPNGAGKTTFAREYLPKEAEVIRFINVDLLAQGLSPLNPELSRTMAGRLFFSELNKMVKSRSNFAIESTLSGTAYAKHIKSWKMSGYHVSIVFLKLKSAQLALKRISLRVKLGGHDVPKEDVLRRFTRGWNNFQSIYRPLADEWAVYENSGTFPKLLESNR